MSSKRMTLRHLWGGGFASDYGATANVAPSQTGDVVFPFLTTAKNVFFELDGAPHKIGGTAKLNSSVLESGLQIRGLFDFWHQGTTYTPTQRRIVYCSTKILADSADGTFVAIKTGLETDKVPCFTVFNDQVIMSSDSLIDPITTWDGTSVASLTDTPPQFSFSCVHKNHVWAAGVAAFPSRLYYSKQFDATNWETSMSPDFTSGHIDIDPNDGDRITAIASHKDNLWVFKGPYKGSIHRIAGSANTGSDSYTRITFINGLGAVSHNTLFRLRDDLGFMWSDGTIHSLAATSAYGDYNESALSRPIHKYIRENVNLSKLSRAWAATNVSTNQVWFTVPTLTNSYCDQVLMMDFTRQGVWWGLLPALDANCVARVIDPVISNRPIFMIGGKDGYVRKTDQSTRSIDGVTAIDAEIDTPFTNYGTAIALKTLANASLGIAPKGNYSISFGWTRDGNAQQLTSVTQAGFGDVLGPASANQFTLDTSVLAGSQYVDVFPSMEEGGEFRAISYQVRNNVVGQDFEVHSISTQFETDSQSTESQP